MIAVRSILSICLTLSCFYYLAALYAASIWRRSSRSGAQYNAGNEPAVTVLKPVAGSDPEQAANFASFFAQDYPEYQIVFGALDPADPALEIAKSVAAGYAEADLAIVAGGPDIGLNRKVSNLANMVKHARHDV